MDTLKVIICLFSILGPSRATKSIVYVQRVSHHHHHQPQQQQQDIYNQGDTSILQTTKCPTQLHELPVQTHAEQVKQTGSSVKTEPQVEEWHFMDSPIKIPDDEILPMIERLYSELGQEDHDEAHEPAPEAPIEIGFEERGFDMVNNRFASDKLKIGDDIDRKSNWIEWKKIIGFHPSGQELLRNRKQHLASKFHIKSSLDLSGPKLESPAQSQRPSMILPPILRSHEEPSKVAIESPTVVVTAARKGDLEANELQQQQDTPQFIGEPVVQHLEDQQHQLKLDNSQGKLVGLMDDGQTANKVLVDSQASLKASPSAYQRVRESLLNAANVARNLASRASATADSQVAADRRTEQTGAPKLLATNLTSMIDGAAASEAGESGDLDDNTWQIWANSERLQLKADIASGSTQFSPKFLGFGQLQRLDRLYGNERAQARLSCQFGDERALNMSISHVEWARFVGPYNLTEQPPSFECSASLAAAGCRLAQVKTDTITTIHPRPVIQNSINTLVPSYTLTLHQVNQDNLGTYRCSAIRNKDGSSELVYRVIPLDY